MLTTFKILIINVMLEIKGDALMKKLLMILFTAIILTACNNINKDDLKILNPNNTDQYVYVYKGEVKGLRIYIRKLSKGTDIPCTGDIVEDTLLNNVYYLPGGGSGSCYEATIAVKDGVKHTLSDGDGSTQKKLGISVEELCKIDGVCLKEE